MEPTFLGILLQCLMPLMAVVIICGGFLGLSVALDILTGIEPGSKKSLLYPLFQEGAIFGPSKEPDNNAIQTKHLRK